MALKNIPEFTPKNKADWRLWLEKNHLSEEAIWLVIYKKSAAQHTIPWSDVVDEALCFGWIDSTRKTIDSEKYKQFYTKRKAKSTWSKINKDKVARLIRENLMFPAGLKTIEIAKQNGSWTFLDSIDQLIVPEDFENALKINPIAKDFYVNISNSKKKMLLYHIKSAKRQETRAKRIEEIVTLASEHKIPKQFG